MTRACIMVSPGWRHLFASGLWNLCRDCSGPRKSQKLSDHRRWFMLTATQVSWKNRANAVAWCKIKGVKFIDYGAFDVHYQKPEQKGVIVNKPSASSCKRAMRRTRRSIGS